MQIFFSETNLNSNIEDEDTSGTFSVVDDNDNTRYFYAGVEYGECFDDLTIFDGCGRKVPISVDDVPSLVLALNKCYSNYRELKKARELEVTIQSNTSYFVEKDDEFEMGIYPALYD